MGGERPVVGRWGTAFALGLAVLLFGAIDPFTLVIVPWAALFLAFPARRRSAAVVAVVLAVWLLVRVSPADPLGVVTRAWTLLLAACLVAAVAFRPGPFLGRALIAISAAFALVGAWLGVSGSWRVLDTAARDRIQTVALDALGRFAASAPDAPWAQDPAGAAERVANLWWMLFPALLALQSLAALGLAWWAWTRSGPQDDPRRMPLARLREFRFADELVWVPIAALVLILLPWTGALVRAAANVLLFMGGLYTLRGIGVLAFVIGSALPPFAAVFGAVLAVLLYPVALVSALAIGLGDTWLDVRKRVTKSTS